MSRINVYARRRSKASLGQQRQYWILQ